MLEPFEEPFVLVTSEAQLPPNSAIWGTGGWLPPEQREALDWLTLARLSGWGVNVRYVEGTSLPAEFPSATWIVIACDPESLNGEFRQWIIGRLAAEPIVVIARASNPGMPLAELSGVKLAAEPLSGLCLTWTGPGPGRHWNSKRRIRARALELEQDVQVWATLEGVPIVTSRKAGQGVVVTFGFHPSEARDADGAGTSLLKHLLIWSALTPVAWLDHTGTLVPRMDDPGGAQNVYSRNWNYSKLDEAKWGAIAAELQRRDARLSIGYVAGWVDDGDPIRGDLQVADRVPTRVAGRVYASPTVQYLDRAGHIPGMAHDYTSEFRGIQSLRAAGLGDVELHGYTHMHPDTRAWGNSPDRYETWPATTWFREFGSAAQAHLTSLSLEQHPLALGLAALGEHFGVVPTTFIPPGDQWTNETLERALGLRLQLVSSYYLAIRDHDRFCWTTHVCAPYFDEPDSGWFDAELPVVGYFHDREPTVHGVEWFPHWLDQWHAVGTRRFIDCRELAAAVGRRLFLRRCGEALHLRIDRENAPKLVRPLQIHIRNPNGALPTALRVMAESDMLLTVKSQVAGVGTVLLPESKAARF